MKTQTGLKLDMGEELRQVKQKPQKSASVALQDGTRVPARALQGGTRVGSRFLSMGD